MKVTCNNCGSDHVWKNGHRNNKQLYKCAKCKKEGSIPSAFNGGEQTKPVSSIGISISEFREKHDLNFIVTKILKTLDRKLLYEKSDVAKLCKLNPTYPNLRATLEETKDFEQHRGRVASKFYYGHPDTILQLKEEGQLT